MENSINLQEALERVYEKGERLEMGILFMEDMPALLEPYLLNAPTFVSGYVMDKITARLNHHREDILHPHNIKPDQLLRVREALSEPVAIVKNKGRLVVVTDVLDYKKDLIMAVIDINERMGSNWVASMYGKDNLLLMLYNRQESGDILYLNEKKIIQALSDSFTNQLKRGSLSRQNFYDNVEAAVNIVSGYRSQRTPEVNPFDKSKYRNHAKYTGKKSIEFQAAYESVMSGETNDLNLSSLVTDIFNSKLVGSVVYGNSEADLFSQKMYALINLKVAHKFVKSHKKSSLEEIKSQVKGIQREQNPHRYPDTDRNDRKRS